MRNLYNIKRLKKIKRFVFLVFILVLLHFYSYADTIFSDSFSGSHPGSWYIGHDGGGGSYSWAWPNGYAHEYSNPSGGQYYYPNDLHVYMERRYVNLSSYTSATLSFYYVVDTEQSFDFFTVNVRDQYGSWHEMFRTSGPHDLTWVSKTINLDQFAGQSGLYIQFRFDSDGSVSGSPYDGVFVDVVVLTASGSITEPDLIPYQPSGWSDEIVVSNTTGTNSDSIIYANQTAYIDYSVLNDGTGDTGGGFYVELWDDTTGERIRRGYRSSSLSAGYYYTQQDSQWTFTQSGWHTIRVKVDADNHISNESNENNNEYTRQVYVYPEPTYPDLVPYKPSGWSSEIVISNSSGTNSDSTIYVNQTSYLDYAVLNDGNRETGVGFYVELWDDTTGQLIRRGYRSTSLSAGYFYTQQDSQWTFTQTGWHTIRVKIDADNDVSNESNEGNNEYTRQIFVTNVVINENEIPGVPVYRNSNTIYNIGPAGNDGICVATALCDVLAYWDRNPYSGIKYWNIVDHGIAPLQDAVPTQPGHNQGDVVTLVVDAATQYYINNTREDNVIEDICNTQNGLSFDAVYQGPVSSDAQKGNLFTAIVQEIDSDRPLIAGSWGNHFGGPHEIPVLGYKQYSDQSDDEIFIHTNTGGVDDEYVNWYAPGWGDADITTILPGGTPNDHYENDDNFSTAKEIFPDDTYTFRQTHNFHIAGNMDVIKFQAQAPRRYTIETKNLGTACDTEIGLVGKNSTTTYTIATDDNSGAGNASKIVWDCYDASDSPFYIVVNEKYNRSGHNTNYDIEVSYEPIIVPQTPIPYSPPDGATISTLTPGFDWSTFQHGGDNQTQTGFQVRVRCDTDGDIIVYDTGFIPNTSGHTHTYTPGAYSGYDSISECNRVSNSLVFGKHYHWHIRYRDSGGDWGAWSADDPNPHQDFYTQPITYTLNVTVNPTGSGTVTKNPDKSSYYQNEVVVLTASPAPGYTFTGWSGSVNSSANPLSVTMNSNKNITANFTPITYTLNTSVNPSGSGSVTKNPNKSSYNYNEVVQLTANPAAGYAFSGWSGDVISTNNPVSVAMNSNKNITANFTPITYTLNVSVNPSGSGSVTKNPNKSSYNYNEVVQLTATPAAGYIFSNWSGDASGTANPLSVTMNSNKNITANFTPITYTLNVSVNPSGSGGVTKNPAKSSYNYNEVVQLTATPAAGYTFSGWSGDASGTANPLSVTMNSNKNITANFTAITYTLNVSVNPSGSGSVTKNPNKSSYNHNEVVQLTATPAVDYTFSGWSGDASGTANPLSVTMNSNKTITANFIQSNPEGNLSVIPVEDFNSSGTAGGPFTPSSKVYTVTNTGGTAINFSVTKSAGWITLANTGQTLQPDESVIVTVSIHDSANSLPDGTYNDTLVFTNTTNNNGNTTRAVVLTVNLPTDPHISSLSQDSGPVGTNIIIYGSNFGSTQETVTFNGVNAVITSWSDTEINTEVPNSATTGPVVVHTAAGDSNGVTFTVIPGSAKKADFDRDGNADVIWRYQGMEGYNAVWLSGNASSTASEAGISSTNEVKKEMNIGIGKPGMVLTNSSWATLPESERHSVIDGFAGLENWPGNASPSPNLEAMSRVMATSVSDPRNDPQSVNLDTVADQNWKLAGTGDFNGDGNIDIVWSNVSTAHNCVWYMDGTTYLGYGQLPDGSTTDWVLGGVGDFDRDGNPDLIWHNVVDGRNGVWYLDGVQLKGIDIMTAGANVDWQLCGTGDFNNDGHVDLVWRNISDGRNAVWYMDGVELSSVGWLDTVADQNWKLRGTGDFNNDGKIDLIWTYISDGRNCTWYLDDITLTGVEFLTTVTDTTWMIRNQ